MENGNLKLAIQKQGRLMDKSLQLLRSCGLDIENYSERLLISSRNFGLDLLFLRDDDIPEYVQDGVADIGILGENIVCEKRVNVDQIKKLGFGRCRLMLATPDNSKLKSLKDINGKTIATAHPVILKDFLKRNEIDAKVIHLNGSVEIAPSLGIADLICDIVSTGNTLLQNKLKKSFTVFDSEAVLICSKNTRKNAQKNSVLEHLVTRINSVLIAKKSKYLMLNAPKKSLEKIIKVVPALKSPTILPLADKEMVAVHAVITTDKFWAISDRLKEAGASGILLISMDNMIL